MKNSYDDLNAGPMPADLVEIDQALRQVEISERASFEAELRAELAQEWARMSTDGPARGFRGFRYASAAAVALLVTGTLAVPPARASLVRLLWPVPEEEVIAQAPEPVVPPALVEEVVVEEPVPFSKPSPRSLPEVPMPDVPDFPAVLPTTFPVLLDRETARDIVADEYPDSLQAEGVGGRVQVMLWVTKEGAVDYPQISKSSGLADLDMAALRATRTLHFLPATRSGETVGTWVEFSIEFRPFAEGPEFAPEETGLQIPLSN